MIERFRKYRVEDCSTGEQFDTTCLFENMEGGMMLAETGGSRFVRVTNDGEPHPNCAWGAHRVLQPAT